MTLLNIAQSKEEFDAMLEAKQRARRYSIIRAHRDKDGEWKKVEATNLPWEEAKRREKELEAPEKAAHPEKTSWTRDVFYRELETSASGGAE